MTLFQVIDANRAYLQPWFQWVDETFTPSDTERFIKAAWSGNKREQEVHFGIGVEEKLVGVAGAHPIRQVNRSTEIGYWLGEAFQGRGIMASAVSVLFGYLFLQRGVNRIEARCAVHNERSQSVMEGWVSAMKVLCEKESFSREDMPIS